ncbi:hypothetical protein FBU59_001021 [Linderina macrospora]|uniref:Uncharacterized protein n=1 Tax=Linderina macrospora TaxID=4868 RepID=A0ACC1JF38_9FUNG|nr:hypothetical protein FBU59_001021 [Linderina macrospora]
MGSELEVYAPKRARVKVTYGTQRTRPTTPDLTPDTSSHTTSETEAPPKATPRKRQAIQQATLLGFLNKTKRPPQQQKNTLDKAFRIISKGSLRNTPPKTQKAPEERKKEQTFLDFGQRLVSPDPCKQCGMPYQRGRDEDEALHTKFHRSWKRRQATLLAWSSGLPSASDSLTVAYKASKGAVPGTPMTAVIQIIDAQSPKRCVTRALEILNLANDHLGACLLAPEQLADRQRKIFLYISPTAQVLGCVLAEQVDCAQRIVPAMDGHVQEYSRESVKAVCGISRIWVVPAARRTGIASQMIEAVAKRFLYGCPVDVGEIAFTQPTGDGRVLAERVFGRRDFLVYAEE